MGQETDDGSWGVERFLGFLGRKAEGRRACLEVMDSQDFEALRCSGCLGSRLLAPSRGTVVWSRGWESGWRRVRVWDGRGCFLSLGLGQPGDGPFLQPPPGADAEASGRRKLKAESRRG